MNDAGAHRGQSGGIANERSVSGSLPAEGPAIGRSKPTLARTRRTDEFSIEFTGRCTSVSPELRAHIARPRDTAQRVVRG